MSVSNDPHPLKIIYMGTPDFALPALDKIFHHPDFAVVAVYTQPPRPAGRGQKLKNSVIHDYAAAHGLPVFTPASFKKDPAAVTQFQSLNADIAVVAAYGLILPPAILAAPRLGCLNIHGSLLPRWRGAAPIQRAIEAGDTHTGITIMQMDAGLDTGAMIVKRSLPILADTNSQQLYEQLSVLGAELIVATLENLQQGKSPATEPQDTAAATYARMIDKQEGKINWGQHAAVIDRKIRAFTPWPGGWCADDSGKRFKILRGRVSSSPDPSPSAESKPGTILTPYGHIACGENSVYQILEIQPENSRPMSFESALNGQKLRVGDILGDILGDTLC